jgi:hypothetical protein
MTGNQTPPADSGRSFSILPAAPTPRSGRRHYLTTPRVMVTPLTETWRSLTI